jgi:hypothetical protein
MFIHLFFAAIQKTLQKKKTRTRPSFHKNKKAEIQFSRKKHSCKNFCLHSQVIYGNPVETLEPYFRGYMKENVRINFHHIVTIGCFIGQAVAYFIKYSNK